VATTEGMNSTVNYSNDNRGDEFDRELFEPTHNGEDGDEGSMEGSHVFHNENLYDDDGIIHQHAQGTTVTDQHDYTRLSKKIFHRGR
jgi:hypothetical protein